MPETRGRRAEEMGRMGKKSLSGRVQPLAPRAIQSGSDNVGVRRCAFYRRSEKRRMSVPSYGRTWPLACANNEQGRGYSLKAEKRRRLSSLRDRRGGKKR